MTDGMWCFLIATTATVKTFWMKNGWKSPPSVSHEELYDLVFDPNEQNNLAGSSEQIAQASLQDLRRQLDEWMKQTKDPLLDGPVSLVKGGHIVPQDADSPKGLKRLRSTDIEVDPTRF